MAFDTLLLIGLALGFAFLNGLHDAANSIATVVSTHVLSARTAVLWAAFFNFIAFFFFGFRVAENVGKGIIDVAVIDGALILSALVGACGWDIVTWYFGLPTSSSHALIGGMVGAALVKAGPRALVWTGVGKTAAFILISPAAGLLLGLVLALAISWLFRRRSPANTDRLFRGGQVVSAAAYSLGHGGNDAQKTMGIVAGLLFSRGLVGDNLLLPPSLAALCYGALALGTLCGGWRIVKTMGQKVTKLRPMDGFSVEMAAAATLFATAAMGAPVSTTQTTTGALAGVGTVRRVSAVRWGVMRRIAWAWVLTIPCSALLAAFASLLCRRFF